MERKTQEHRTARSKRHHRRQAGKDTLSKPHTLTLPWESRPLRAGEGRSSHEAWDGKAATRHSSNYLFAKSCPQFEAVQNCRIVRPIGAPNSPENTLSGFREFSMKTGSVIRKVFDPERSDEHATKEGRRVKLRTTVPVANVVQLTRR